MARFTVQNDDPEGSAIHIYDDDFGFDACFKITGDWSAANKLRYAEAVCNVLNFHDAVIPTPSTIGGWKWSTITIPKPARIIG